MDAIHSFALSDTTTRYHSFHDIELQEPPSPRRSRSRHGGGVEGRAAAALAACHRGTTPPAAAARNDARTKASSGTGYERKRQDSGYAAQACMTRAPRTRPSTRRSAKSYPQPTPSSLPLHARTASAGAQSAHASSSQGYFYFPAPQLIDFAADAQEAEQEDQQLQENHHHHHHHHHHSESHAESHVPRGDQKQPLSPPPATTHYWTSDSTRRLEYAAIDAASRGVKGWIRRHLVPECFAGRHVGFEDDSGSVRRYRLDLDEQDLGHPEKQQGQQQSQSRSQHQSQQQSQSRSQSRSQNRSQHQSQHQSQSQSQSPSRGLEERRRGWSFFSLRKSRTV
ncbi:hypothetical protein E4U59_006944 [Claviceps monticola]|nr:hypothetical protein E4U59_006944 [Claviceps monticola]